MTRCMSGNHVWFGAQDAGRCCNPGWRRITVTWEQEWQPGDRSSAVYGLSYRWVPVPWAAGVLR